MGGAAEAQCAARYLCGFAAEKLFVTEPGAVAIGCESYPRKESANVFYIG
jgi:hypothetical protein